jgi:cytohesin
MSRRAERRAFTTQRRLNNMLALAAANCDVEGVKRLLSMGASPGAKTELGYNALEAALASGCADAARLLLSATWPTETAVEIACKDPALISLMLEAWPDAAKTYGGRALSWCMKLGSLEAAVLLLAFGADVNTVGPFGAPLHIAAERGRLDLVQVLIERGADVNIRDSQGRTPLHAAAIGGNAEVIRLLIKLGADVNARDNYGETPLHLVAAEGAAYPHPSYEEAAKALLDAGADVNARNADGKTPLHIASVGNPALVKLFIERGADVNAQDNSGKTPLHYAVEWGSLLAAAALLKAGARTDVRDNDGLTPLDYADSEFLEALKKAVPMAVAP